MDRWTVILDDAPARVERMRAVLRDLLPNHAVVAFDNAPDAIEWLPRGLGWTELMCLDHDLGATRIRDGTAFDPGTGRDVADALGRFPAVAPVIVHSTNAAAVPGMLRVLREVGWSCSAVVPHDDLEWIELEWRDRLRNLIEVGELRA